MPPLEVDFKGKTARTQGKCRRRQRRHELRVVPGTVHSRQRPERAPPAHKALIGAERHRPQWAADRARRHDGRSVFLDASGPRKGQRVAVRDIGASCHDGRHPATAMFDGQKFWATTGLFPQSALARLPSPTRLSSLSLDVGPSVRQVTVSVGHEDEFEDVATVTFEGGGNKRVSLENVLARDVRIRIDLCSESFAIIQSVEVVGVPA